MKVLLEEKSTCSFDSTPSEKQRSSSLLAEREEEQSPPRVRPRRASMSRACSLTSLFGRQQSSSDKEEGHREGIIRKRESSRPPSPRSTLMDGNVSQHHVQSSGGSDPANRDGVILTGTTTTTTTTTRTGKMTRRHSMSRMLGGRTNASRESNGDHGSVRRTPSGNLSVEQMAQMRPGVKRKDSFRATMLTRSRHDSEESLQTTSTSRTRNSHGSAGGGTGMSGSGEGGNGNGRASRRNSLGSRHSSTSASVVSHTNGSAAPSGSSVKRRGSLSRTKSHDPTARPKPNSMRGLTRTPSYRKSDSLRDWNKSGGGTHVVVGRGQRGIGSHPTGLGGSFSTLPRDGSVADLMLDCNTTVSVSNTWASVRRMPDHARLLGEQIVVRLIELQPETARTNMRLESFFSPRFDELCDTLTQVIDMVVTLLGPDLDECSDELARLGQRCRDQGISIVYLGEAISTAMETLLKDDVTSDMIRAWKTTFDSLSNRLYSSVPSL